MLTNSLLFVAEKEEKKRGKKEKNSKPIG